MGDDLKKARAFVRDSKTTLAGIMAGADTLSSERIAAHLANIQSSAEANHALAIGRVAVQAQKDYQSSRSIEKRQGNLLALNKLVLQYEAGLNELTADQSVDTSDSTQRDLTALTSARANLKSVMSHARPGREKRILTRLVKISKIGESRDGSLPVLETMMPGLTNDILRLARQNGKQVSVSFSMDDIQLSEEVYNHVAECLTAAGKSFIEQVAENPDLRQSKGQSQSAQLAITACQDNGLFHILMTCQGRDPNRRLLAASDFSSLSSHGGKWGQSVDDDVVSIAIADLPVFNEKTEAIWNSSGALVREMRA